jgi:hypothetical protein
MAMNKILNFLIFLYKIGLNFLKSFIMKNRIKNKLYTLPDKNNRKIKIPKLIIASLKTNEKKNGDKANNNFASPPEKILE